MRIQEIQQPISFKNAGVSAAVFLKENVFLNKAILDSIVSTEEPSFAEVTVFVFDNNVTVSIFYCICNVLQIFQHH